jgi:hypothetical protein
MIGNGGHPAFDPAISHALKNAMDAIKEKQ